jgi:endonuclease YncB( thermonuclease family)
VVNLRWLAARAHLIRAAAALLCGICVGCASAAVDRVPVDVIDGDTIRLADEVVRLEGIDAQSRVRNAGTRPGVSMPADG